MLDKIKLVIVVKKSRLKVTEPDAVPAKIDEDVITAKTSCEGKPLNNGETK